VCYCNVLLQYSTVQCYGYVFVTVMFCYNTVHYNVTVMCVCYCNVLLQYSAVQRYSYVCVLLKCVASVQYNTALLLCVCVTVMCCYSTVQRYVMCVCYCNVSLQYSTFQRYCYVCVLL